MPSAENVPSQGRLSLGASITIRRSFDRFAAAAHRRLSSISGPTLAQPAGWRCTFAQNLMRNRPRNWRFANSPSTKTWRSSTSSTSSPSPAPCQHGRAKGVGLWDGPPTSSTTTELILARGTARVIPLKVAVAGGVDFRSSLSRGAGAGNCWRRCRRFAFADWRWVLEKPPGPRPAW